MCFNGKMCGSMNSHEIIKSFTFQHVSSDTKNYTKVQQKEL